MRWELPAPKAYHSTHSTLFQDCPSLLSWPSPKWVAWLFSLTLSSVDRAPKSWLKQKLGSVKNHFSPIFDECYTQFSNAFDTSKRMSMSWRILKWWISSRLLFTMDLGLSWYVLILGKKEADSILTKWWGNCWNRDEPCGSVKTFANWVWQASYIYWRIRSVEFY